MKEIQLKKEILEGKLALRKFVINEDFQQAFLIDFVCAKKRRNC